MISYERIMIDGHDTFYREAGSEQLPPLLLLHGFPSSSHMFRDLIPKLADRFHIIAPDYPGFGYSAQPPTEQFAYTFDNLAAHIEKLLSRLGLRRFAMYVQDYGGPIGFRIASRNPASVMAIVVQNANAYEEGLSAAWAPLRALWTNYGPETVNAVQSFLAAETTIFQYTHGVSDRTKVSPDSYTVDQTTLDRKGNHEVQICLFRDYASNLKNYDKWHAYFREFQPRTLIVWGKNDPFFTTEGAHAFLRDLPKAELHLLDTGHFALEDHCDQIANAIRKFLPGQDAINKTAAK